MLVCCRYVTVHSAPCNVKLHLSLTLSREQTIQTFVLSLLSSVRLRFTFITFLPVALKKSSHLERPFSRISLLLKIHTIKSTPLYYSYNTSMSYSRGIRLYQIVKGDMRPRKGKTSAVLYEGAQSVCGVWDVMNCSVTVKIHDPTCVLGISTFSQTLTRELFLLCIHCCCLFTCLPLEHHCMTQCFP